MEIALIVAGIIQLVLIILFWKLVGDVEMLKDRFTGKNASTLLDKYKKDKFFKRNESALHHLQEFIWVMLHKSPGHASHEALREKWAKEFELMNSTFPDNPYKSGK